VSSFDRFIHSAGRQLERVPKDVTLAVVVAVVQLAVTLPMAHTQELREPVDALAVLLLVAGPAALVLRQRAPVAVLAATVVVAAAYWALDYPRGPVFLATIIAFVAAVIAGHRAAAWILLALCWPAFVWLPSAVGDMSAPPLGKALGVAVWLVLLAAAAEIIRAKGERHHEEQRAREQEALALAGQERLRIARELHDVLAHNVSLINVQAGVALHLLDEQPERARPALEAIKHASSETLGEMRSVLSILRRPGEQPPRSPTAGIAGIGDLVARTSAAGIQVETTVSGDPRPVPASVDLAVYRIVQEALTNVRMHAPGAPTTVRVAWRAGAIALQVRDRGPGPDGHEDGHGLLGMRERVRIHGGRLRTGSAAGGGFEVLAELPVP